MEPHLILRPVRALARIGAWTAAWTWCSLLPALLAGEFSPPRVTSDGFSVPQPGRHFEFPRDHGSHPEFKIEWWYVTGHLYGEREQRYGFQATFFRRSGPRSSNENSFTNPATLFDHDELHLAHMALLDVREKRFLHQERLNRSGWDAAASTTTLAVRNGNWSLRLGTNGSPPLSLQGSIRAEAAFSLELSPTKPLVLFGENGISRKGASATASSYYLTFPRLEVSGRLTLEGREQAVHGQAWMDHEISSSQLDDDQAGWDWASLQLDDGREIMAYRMRQRDGSTDPFSTLAWVDTQGQVTHLGPAQFTWSTLRTWKSPATGGVYPVHVQLTTVDPTNGQPVRFILEPLLPEQELIGKLGGVAYWEGACRVLDASDREIGSAYLELTGYVGSLTERLR
jgi:predicted secreted hydrolase